MALVFFYLLLVRVKEACPYILVPSSLCTVSRICVTAVGRQCLSITHDTVCVITSQLSLVCLHFTCVEHGLS